MNSSLKKSENYNQCTCCLLRNLEKFSDFGYKCTLIFSFNGNVPIKKANDEQNTEELSISNLNEGQSSRSKQGQS